MVAMGRGFSRGRRAVLSIACAALLATCVGGADAALVKGGSLVLRADGGFTPSAPPAHSYAPTDFKGHAAITDTTGAAPTPLQEVILDFDRDGKLETRGIPVCPLRKIAHRSEERRVGKECRSRW